MVERFNQQELKSAQVGIPEADNSASTAAAIIAEAANKQRDAVLQQASRRFAQAESNFSQLSRDAAQLEYSLDYARKQQANQQRQLQSGLARLDEDDRLNSRIATLQESFASAPDKAVSAFQNSVAAMRSEFEERYKDDPQLLAMLLPTQRQAEHKAMSVLSAWSAKTNTENLKSRLELVPLQLLDRIDRLGGSLDEQVEGFRDLQQSTGNVYQSMKSNAGSQAEFDGVLAKELTLKNRSAEHFVKHLMTQVPEGESGIKYIDTLKGLVSHAQELGISLASDNQKSLAGDLETARNNLENGIKVDIETTGTINVVDAKMMRFALDNAQNDPASMSRIDAQIKEQAKQVRARIDVAEREPDGKIRKAKVVALKQELSELLGVAEKETSSERSLEAIERSRRGEIRAIESQGRSIEGFATAMLRFQQGQEDRRIREEHGAVVKEFNNKWTDVLKDQEKALSLKGDARHEAVMELTRKAYRVLDEGRDAGALTADAYGNHLKGIKSTLEAIQSGGETKEVAAGLFGLGGTKTVMKKPAERVADEMKAQQAVNQLVAREMSLIGDMKSTIIQMKALKTSPGESALMENYIHSHLPVFMNNPKYQQMSAQQQSTARAKWLNTRLQEFRRGMLK